MLCQWTQCPQQWKRHHMMICFLASQHHTNLTQSKIWLLKETWCLEKNISKRLIECCVLDVSALVNIWRFGRFGWIPRRDLIGEDPTKIGKIHQRQNAHPKNHLSRKVKTHHLQNRTSYLFEFQLFTCFFGGLSIGNFINHHRQAPLRRSRVLSWTLGRWFTLSGWFTP